MTTSLDQGWTAEDIDWFYTTAQGSELLNYDFFLALEQTNNRKLFRERKNMEQYGWLYGPKSRNNPDRLPIGFAKSKTGHVGLNCAACHTSKIEHGGKSVMVQGGAPLIDLAAFLKELTAALGATLNDKAKLERFLVATKASKKDLVAAHQAREAQDRANYSDVTYGPGRYDAFGAIFNAALKLADPGNGHPADAPVSYPVLWDTPQHDYVQWNGVQPNHGLGALQRNAGQLIGVFGSIDVNPKDMRAGYPSSVDGKVLLEMEEHIKRMRAPVWPRDVLGELDSTKVAKGKLIYAQLCATCHMVIDRAAPNRKVVARLIKLSTIGTDPTAAKNIVARGGKTGTLAGRKLLLSEGEPLGKQAPALQIVIHLVAGVVNNLAATGLATEINTMSEVGARPGPEKRGDYIKDSKNPSATLLAYKARPHTGIWASAPYLHNGSVPNLYAMLTPPDKRPKKFWVGSSQFDAKKVGYSSKKQSDHFEFDTTVAGNANTGHKFGTHLSDDDRWALIEYLKSL